MFPGPRLRRTLLALVPAAIALAIAAMWLVARPSPTRTSALGMTAMLAAAAGTTHPSTERRKPNRLIHEKSPYLLQHAYNPVDWRPWGDEAFAEARREDKPIFLSIGYSTCHWCHVMERESFEDDSIAALLNRDFIPIKVDREERPDVDRIYMSAMQALGMGGGWPLNAFLTPNLEPFYGGTYFPPHAMHGRPGMTEMLPRVAEAWKEHRADLEQTGSRVLEALAADSAADTTGVEHGELFAAAYDSLSRSQDRELGGFGTAPKFPTPVNLSFLFRYWSHDPSHRATARAIALGQLDAMRTGGIHDQIGGGFHRYSTDREWLTPHFEKMLYDQAQLAWSYLEAYQITNERRYAETARGIFDYVTRDLTAKDGGFDSAEDADSEGEEGKFYVWTPAEVEAAVGKDDATLVSYRYGVTAAGNFEHGASILHLAHTLAETAAHVHLSEPETEKRLTSARAKLLEARGHRVRPHRDDKVLTAWNGLMISAYARGARVLDDPALAEHASRAAEFAWTTLRDPKTGALSRRWRDGEAGGQGQLDDYANLALGFVDLYEATFEPKWLERAVALTEAMVPRFWDEEHGAFFESPAGDASIRVRMKDGYDGAEIAGNSIATLVLVRLGKLLDRREWLEHADRALDYYGRRIQRYPAAMPQMLVAMELSDSPPRHAVIAGNPAAADTRAMIAEFNRGFRPHDTLLLVDGGVRQAALAKLAPFTVALAPKDGKATAYVCVNYACRLPTTDHRQFAAQLDEGFAATAEKR